MRMVAQCSIASGSPRAIFHASAPATGCGCCWPMAWPGADHADAARGGRQRHGVSAAADLTEALGLAMRIVAADRSGARGPHRERSPANGARERSCGCSAGVRVLVLAPVAAPPLNRGIGEVRASDGTVFVPLTGTPGASPGAVTIRLRGGTVGRAIAAPPSGVSLPLPPLGPGWWVGEAILDPDELRADDRRLFVWHVAPETRVATAADAGPFVAAAVEVLREAKRVASGNEVTIGGRPRGDGGTTTIVFPTGRSSVAGRLDRVLEARGTRGRYGAPGTSGPIAAQSSARSAVPALRRHRIVTGMVSTGRGP